MNKTKMILAATGGAIGLAVLVMAYFVWSAYSAKVAALEGDAENGEEGLETVKAAAASLSSVAGGKVYPCPASVKAIESNTASVVEWKDMANKLASRGDRPVKVTTPAQFKSDMVEEAKRIASLPGSADGKLVKADFAFGPFKPYVAEGQMPAEAKLAELTRQWDDVVSVIDLLVASGVSELLDVQLRANANASADDASADGKKGSRPGRTSAKTKEAKADVTAVAHSYVFSFTTRAPGLVKAINALATGERFIVIDSLTFVREKDVIAEALGDANKKENAQASGGGRRGRRRARQAEDEKEKDEPKGGIVTDPLLDAPLKVDLVATVYDFGSLEEEKTEEKKGEAK